MATGKAISLQLGGQFDGASLSPDGRTVAVREMGGTVRLFDAETGQEVRVLARGLFPNVNAVFLAFSPDGGRLAVQRFDGDAVEVLDVGTGRRVWSLLADRRLAYALGVQPRRPVPGVHLPRGRGRVGSGDRSSPVHPHGPNRVGVIAFNPDGERLAVLVGRVGGKGRKGCGCGTPPPAGPCCLSGFRRGGRCSSPWSSAWMATG